MDEIRPERPPCHWCASEERKNPNIGILFTDLDGSGRKPVCGEHFNAAREKFREAIIHGPASGFGVKGQA